MAYEKENYITSRFIRSCFASLYAQGLHTDSRQLYDRTTDVFLPELPEGRGVACVYCVQHGKTDG